MKKEIKKLNLDKITLTHLSAAVMSQKNGGEITMGGIRCDVKTVRFTIK